jgi:phosphohistidine swiveling domain-containing protein
MKTSLETCSRLDETLVSDPGVERREKTRLAGGRVVINLMAGRAVSPGTATGRAVVVTNKDDMARVGEGTVMVSRTASPILLTAMSRARAMATEIGSQGATASLYARMAGVPAVVGISDFIKTVRDGDLVRVDGTRGTVVILEHAA